MRKYKMFGVAILYMACMAVGCGSGTEGPRPTVAVSPTEAVVTEQPTPTEEVVAVPEGLPIDGEHFGDDVFCKFLKRNYDTDENGVLSEEELTKVKSLMLPPGTPVGTLKGFSHFPNLESVVLPPVEQVEFVGVPALKKVSNSTALFVNQRYINSFKVADCPALEELEFSDVTVGTEGDTEENFVIENCPKLERLSFSEGELGNMRGRIAGTPLLEVDFDGHTELPKKLIMDGEVTVGSRSLEYDYEQMKLRDGEKLPFVWTAEESDAQTAAWQKLRKTVEEIKQDFSITVEAVVPAVYDENGAQAFYVLLDHASIEPELYQWRYEDIYCIPTPSYVLLYEKEPPKAEQFTIEWSNPERYELYEYSPVSDIKGEYYAELAVCRTTEDGKETLGTFGLSFDYAFNEQGEIKLLYHGYMFFYDEIPTEGVWQPQRSEPVAPVRPTEDDIPIDKEHFSGVFMRRYVEAVIDTDRNGYLSKKEREAVTEIDMFEVEMGLDVIDGFEWFPNLESISMPSCTEMVVRNCPNLVYTGAGEGCGADKLIIENCPKLEELFFVYAGVSNLYVKDCESLSCISDYCAWDVGLYDTVWEFVNCPKLTIATGGISEFGKLLIADANEVSVCFANTWDLEVSYKDGMFLLDGIERIKWKNLPEDWFLPSEELLAETFVTDALKKQFGVEELRFDDSRLLMYSPGKGVDYLVDVVLGDAAQENKKMPEVRCCIWITPEKEVVFYNSYETWNEERVPGLSEW